MPSIFPSGNRKVMQKQSYSQDFNKDTELGNFQPKQTPPILQGNGNVNAPEEGLSALQQPIQEQPQTLNGIQENKHPSQNQQTLLKYIISVFSKSPFNYPPRRLQQYKDKFIQQTLHPGELKSVKITLPDEYYGTGNPLSDSDVVKIKNGISQRFELKFNSGSRKQRKLILDFSSIGPQAQAAQAAAQNPNEDTLDQIFGKATNESKNNKNPKINKNKFAQTHQQMLKTASNILFQKLLKVKNENK